MAKAKISKEEAFQKILDELNQKSGGGGQWYHPTPGDTKFRLVLLDGDTELTFYREVINKWGNTKYMVAAVILDAPDRPKDAGPDCRGLVLPLTAMKGIIGNLKAGWDLFDPVKGHGICLTREGSTKFDTTYQVNLSPQAVDVTEFDYEVPAGGLDEWAEAYNSRGNDAEDKTEETEIPKAGTKDSGGIPW